MDDDRDDDDLNLVRASASLLRDLEQSLQVILFKPSKDDRQARQAHSVVRQKDLDYVIKLLEQFQGDPQLLDKQLRTIVPDVADALLQRLSQVKAIRDGHLDLTVAACSLLYTLCKVRGRKIVSGLLHNEARYLEQVVTALEYYASDPTQWQVHYTLQLWLSHLLLTPFNLDSISQLKESEALPTGITLRYKLSDLALRSMQVSVQLVGSAAASREIAALTLVRLCIRPDMQKSKLGDALVEWALQRINADTPADIVQLHTQLGVMHFLAGIAKSADLDHLLPSIFQACEVLSSGEVARGIMDDAVGRKLMLKTMSNIVMTTLRAAGSSVILSRFLEGSGCLEATIETQLQCLADREALVRGAAAKAVSNIILTLEAPMAREVLEALFAILQDDIASSDGEMRNANAFAWHGVVLTLSYALFKRSVSIDQLPDLIKILLRALSFEQRTTTGAVTGTNVRDAANFGLWSLARRTTTAELAQTRLDEESTISTIAVHLLQAACTDPVGNIRRGSSAALQELVGRHPNQVVHGIALVQAVDFVAVGLRQRALIDVAANAMALDRLYFDALVDGLIGWRGLGSSDIASREYAATSLVERAITGNEDTNLSITNKLIMAVQNCPTQDAEMLHGLSLSLALWVDDLTESIHSPLNEEQQIEQLQRIWEVCKSKMLFTNVFEHRSVRSNLAPAIIRLLTGFCKHQASNHLKGETAPCLPQVLEPLLEKLLARTDETLLQLVPNLVRALLPSDDTPVAYRCLELSHLTGELEVEINRPTIHGAARALTIAASIRHFLSHDGVSQHIKVLQRVCQSTYIDWRIVGFKAFKVTIEWPSGRRAIDPDNLRVIVDILTTGMRDFTIDQRGDIGSLVRMEALQCAGMLCTAQEFQPHQELLADLHSGIGRLSLEKLNRVRARASKWRSLLTGPLALAQDIDDVDSPQYFSHALAPLWEPQTPSWARKALLAGLSSCAGSSAEHLTQSSRDAISQGFSSIDVVMLQQIVEELMDLLSSATEESQHVAPILEVIEYLLQSRIMQRLQQSDFKWRRLLAQIQKAHYKSTDVPRLLVAVSIYAWLADSPTIRQDALKKLLSMLKTIPYPRVRAAAADAFFLATSDEALKMANWQLPASQNAGVLADMYGRYITS